MKITRRRLAREVVRLLGEQPHNQSQLLRQVAAYLIQTKQAHQAHLLVSDIAAELAQTQGHVAADVQTAYALTDDTRTAITDMLRRDLHAQTVELNERITPHLIGGVIVSTPQGTIDTSIRRQLNNIAGMRGIK